MYSQNNDINRQVGKILVVKLFQVFVMLRAPEWNCTVPSEGTLCLILNMKISMQ